MYAPHASPAPAHPAAQTHRLILGRMAVLGLPMVRIPFDDAELPESPTVGLVVTTADVAPEVAGFAALAAVLIFFVCHRLLYAPRSSARGSQARYGIGLGVVGLAAAAVAIGGWLGAPAVSLAVGTNVAAVGAGVVFLAALLSMPGPTVSAWVRFRRGLDGAIVGLCFMFCVWVLAVSPQRQLDSPAFWLIMFHCCLIATAVLAVVRPRTGRRGPLLCAAGVCAAMGGLSGLAYALRHGGPVVLFVTVVALLLAAPVLIWRGSRGLGGGHATVARGPLVALPAGLAVAVALYRLVTGGELDRAAMMLGTLAALAMGVRHLSAALARGAAASVPSTPAAEPAPGSRAEAADADPDPAARPSSRRRLSMAIDALRQDPHLPGALLAIRVSGLTGVDGVTGISARDEALSEVVCRLRRAAAAGGGDRTTVVAELDGCAAEPEFALLTPATLAQAYGLADRLVALLAEPMTVAGRTVRLCACVGVTDLAATTGAEDAVRRAEVALRRARQLGPGRIEWYDADVAEAVARRATLDRDLPDALRRGELDLIYQPILDLDRDRPLAVEALLRWRHPQLGTLLPADVIPVAEAVGVLAEVDHWVLRRASAQLATWRSEGRNLAMTINVSAHQFRTPEFAHEVAGVLAAHDLPPEWLVCEVAESGIEDGAGIDEYVAALRSVGVRTALDAFGTGPASLAHLRRLPIDMVKIGQPFFAGAPATPYQVHTTPAQRSPVDLPLIDVMVGVGKRLGIDVVAQCLEAPDQLAVVRTAGCRLGQGRLFARPQPAEHTEAYLDGFVVRRP